MVSIADASRSRASFGADFALPLTRPSRKKLRASHRDAGIEVRGINAASQRW